MARTPTFRKGGIMDITKWLICATSPFSDLICVDYIITKKPKGSRLAKDNWITRFRLRRNPIATHHSLVLSRIKRTTVWSPQLLESKGKGCA